MAITAISTTIPDDIDDRTDISSGWKKLNKGVTPVPFSIVTDTESGKVTVRFAPGDFAESCDGSVSCLSRAVSLTFGESQTVACPEDSSFEVVMDDQEFSDSEPTSVTFTFEDSAGNTTEVVAYSIVSVIPDNPVIEVEETDDGARTHFRVDVSLLSWSGYVLTGVVSEYQIERYVDTAANSRVWVDWRDVDRSRSHLDLDVTPGVNHGYRVRFRIGEGNASGWSSWSSDVP